MSRVVDLRQAVAGLVRDGKAVAMEGSPTSYRWGRRTRSVIPHVAVDAVAVVLGGAHPSYAHDYYPCDSSFYEDWDLIACDRVRFGGWMERHVLGTEDSAGYLESISKRETLVAERSA